MDIQNSPDYSLLIAECLLLIAYYSLLIDSCFPVEYRAKKSLIQLCMRLLKIK